MTHKYALIVAAVSVAALCVAAPTVLGQQATAGGPARLGRVDVTGIRRLSAEQVIALSGLRVGGEVAVATLDAAATRLLDSGLFASAQYRYQPAGAQWIVALEVAEVAWTTPVDFDNFVWWSDDELRRAIAQDLPTFDGLAPDTEPAILTVTNVLNRLLKAQTVGGRAEYSPFADLKTGRRSHRFSVKGVPLPICVLHFPQASGIQEADLAGSTASLLKDDYSRSVVATNASAALIPLYRQRGYLRAQFQVPQARVAAPGSCSGGVEVSVTVDEGLRYAWEQSQWTGNARLTTQELDTALSMKPGEVANGLKIDEGLRAVGAAYGRQGFIQAGVTTSPTFDDARQRVSYQMTVVEGSQYRMGKLSILGLPERDVTDLVKVWQLRAGEIYNTLYLADFLKRQEVARARYAGTFVRTVTTEQKANPNGLTVDVVVTFK